MQGSFQLVPSKSLKSHSHKTMKLKSSEPTETSHYTQTYVPKQGPVRKAIRTVYSKEHLPPMIFSTTYDKDYFEKKPSRRVSYKPIRSVYKYQPSQAATSYSQDYPTYDNGQLKEAKGAQKIYKSTKLYEGYQPQTETTFMRSYKAPENQQRTLPIIHKSEIRMENGDVFHETSYQTAYKEKSYSKRSAKLQRNNIEIPKVPLTGVSNMKENYVEYENPKKEKSFKPQITYVRSASKIPDQTTMTVDYKPWTGVPRVKSLRIIPKYLPPVQAMGDQTEYKKNFADHGCPKVPAKIKGESNLHIISTGSFPWFTPTTHYQQKYVEWKDSKPSESSKQPYDHKPPQNLPGVFTSSYDDDYKGVPTSAVKTYYPINNLCQRQGQYDDVPTTTYQDEFAKLDEKRRCDGGVIVKALPTDKAQYFPA